MSHTPYIGGFIEGHVRGKPVIMQIEAIGRTHFTAFAIFQGEASGAKNKHVERFPLENRYYIFDAAPEIVEEFNRQTPFTDGYMETFRKEESRRMHIVVAVATLLIILLIVI